MRESLIITSLIGSFIVFCMSIDLFNAVVMFVLFGILPGQTNPLPAASMLAIYSAGAVLIAIYALRGGVAVILQAFTRSARRSSLT